MGLQKESKGGANHASPEASPWVGWDSAPTPASAPLSCCPSICSGSPSLGTASCTATREGVAAAAPVWSPSGTLAAAVRPTGASATSPSFIAAEEAGSEAAQEAVAPSSEIELVEGKSPLTAAAVSTTAVEFTAATESTVSQDTTAAAETSMADKATVTVDELV